ncbi:MAG: FAD-dependent oxidoreductase [Chloroflexi bacterium]|nr:MAG: FAD-dependent oxidoreductase [Chloroflexota bacterium]
MQPKNRIAVIGGGVAGIVSAYILSRQFDVTLIEANDYVGGHTNTLHIPDGPDAGTPVDTGFIVLNDRNYPNFNEFLRQLQVEIRKSEMSFSFYCRQTGLAYSSDFPNGLFAQRRNLVNPSFLGMVRDILRFNRDATADLRGGRLNGHTLGEYLAENNYSSAYIENHLAPCAAAIWSTPAAEILDFPVEPFLRFYDNHGLLGLNGRPQWYTVRGGSQTYVRRFLEIFPGTVLTRSPVESVRRMADGVQVVIKNRPPQMFDKVVIAAHADQALRMLADPSPEEQRLLGPWRYHKNSTILHSDAEVMSPNRRMWASWNYIRAAGAQAAVKTIERPVSVAYHMNRLQGLQTRHNYFVSLNDPGPIAERQIIREFVYKHPHFSFESLATQADLPRLNGQRNTYFCGSYFGYGFHEDAVRSAVQVGREFGLQL